MLQAFVSEPLKPMIDHVVTFGAGHFYISQSDKGGLVFGGDIDMYNSYAQKGNLPMSEEVVTAGVAMIPGTAFGKFATDHVRFNFATSRENISKAIEKIDKILK